MYKLFLIGAGGFIGALLRYGLGGLAQSWSKSVTFPYGTLAVNVVGCLLIGGLSYLVETYGLFSPETRSFVFIGLLGAFTTFSTFANETAILVRGRQELLAFANLGLHVFLGLAAVWVGRVLASALWS